MKKLLSSVFAISLLVGCSVEEAKEDVAKSEVKEDVDVSKEGTKQTDFNPEEFVKEAEKHSLEWYIAETEKLTPEEIAELENYQADLEAKELELYQSILENAKTMESVNEEGQKVLEYKMVNTLGRDVEFFQLQWVEGSVENVSQTADMVKDGQEFTLIVDPASDKTLDDIDLSTLSLIGG